MSLRRLGAYDGGMVGIVLIGDEILAARVVESNLCYMIERLAERGYHVGEVRIVGDDVDQIGDTVRELSRRYEFVCTAGGIGPTHDDVTLEAVAKAFHVQVEENSQLRALLASRHQEGEPAVFRMARVPHGSELIGGQDGRWPVIHFGNLYILPGLPRALRDKIDRIVALLPQQAVRARRVVYVMVEEPRFAEWLRALQEREDRVQIGSYPATERSLPYRACVTVSGTDKPRVSRVHQEVREYFAVRDWVFEGDTDG